jgi:ABC-type glycerol-3-phosphate transport system permease component
VILGNTALFLPVPALLMRSFFRTLPDELADAARLEGASEWRVFRDIMVPLARPGVLTALIFAFVWAWNDVLLPVVFLQSPDQFTIPYGIAALRPGDFRQDYVSVFAASIISTAPDAPDLGVPPAAVHRRPHVRGDEGLAGCRAGA